VTALLWWIVADPPWHIDAVGGRSHHQSLEEGIIVNEYTFTEGGRRFG